MKKCFVFLFVLFALGMAFAQSDDGSPMDLRMRVIVPEKKYGENKTAEFRIEYIPGIDEARFYYTCLDVSFDESEARTALRECISDFQVEQNYFSYKYIREDRVSYKKDARGLRQAIYISQVKFLDRTRNQF